MSTNNHKLSDCKGRTGQSQETGTQTARRESAFEPHPRRTATVRPGSHQYPGTGSGKVEEEIRLLDTRPSSRRAGDSQGSLGCIHSARGVETTGSGTSVPTIDGMIDGLTDSFVVDTTPTLGYSHSCLYDRTPGITLGEKNDEPLPSAGQDTRLCFNCGSSDHAVASCPEPIDRQLVSLSRQLFNFLHPDLPGQEYTRFYAVEEWRQQRLEWLRSYEPGVIRGPLLRDALGLQEGDLGDTVEWLRNMAYWGYPPGWVGSRDPRQLVCSRVLDNKAEELAVTSEWEPFLIFEGMDDDEEIDLRGFSLGGPSISSPAGSSSTAPVDVEPTRWAVYPNTYFSSTALSVYSGAPLGRVASSPHRVSATFTPERRALWERILSGGSGTDSIPSVPPWRLPGAFGALSVAENVANDIVPPPPPTTPPPLPPAPILTSPGCTVSSRASISSYESEGIVDVINDGSVVDMDLSDDSE